MLKRSILKLCLMLCMGITMPIASSAALATSCCRVCKTGIACGNACISKTKMCRKPKGCACTGKNNLKASLLLTSPVAVIPATVIDVTDGDTLRVHIDQWPKQIADARIRLLRVDAPEISHAQCDKERAKGKTARAFVTKLLPVGSLINFSLGEQPTDSFGRLLADITLPSGQDLANTLLSNAMAKSYDGTIKPDWCK
jgi:endonuclease YncB( thermonuclease family)